jgi:hypothetical protein
MTKLAQTVAKKQPRNAATGSIGPHTGPNYHPPPSTSFTAKLTTVEQIRSRSYRLESNFRFIN